MALTTEQPTPRRFLIALFLAYAAATLLLTLRHEPWRDEADSWLVARDLPLAGTISWTRSAGTPFLWYTILVPLARSGMPYLTQAIVHWVIALAVVALFLARAPFSGTTKSLFLFSFYPACQYAVIARNYALGILLTFCVVALHARRMTHPLPYGAAVALLPNVNAHSAGPALAAASWFAFELVRARSADARQWFSFLLMCAGMAAAFVQLHTPGYLIPPTVISPPYWGAFVQALTRGFFPAFEATAATMAAILLLGLIVVAIRRSRVALWFLAISLGMLAWIYTFLWIYGFRHYGLMLMMIVAALWLALAMGATSRLNGVVAAGLNLSLALSVVATVRFGYADLTRNYSGSREMARYLISHALDKHEIAAHPPAHCEAVLPYLDRKTFWYAALGEPGSYMKWDRAYRVAMATSPDRPAAAAATHYQGRKWLFLSAAPLSAPEQAGLTLLYATREPLVERRDADGRPNDERYWLYGHGIATTR